MNVYPVSAVSIAGMAAAFILAVAAALFAYLYGRKKLHARASSFLFGAIVFYVVYKLLEPVISATLIGFTGNLITGSVMGFAFFGALIAAVFEEGAKLLTMKTIIKDVQEEDAYMYGAGAGALEALMLTALPQIGNVLNSELINSGIMEESLKVLEEPELSSTYEALIPLWSTSASAFWLAGFERILMLVMCISLSLLMYYYLKTGEKRLLGFTMAAHFAVVFLSTLLSKNVGTFAAEAAVLLMVAGIVYYTVTVRRNYHEPGTEYALEDPEDDYSDFL